MGEAVIISIHPCWCEQIVSGAKTMEVRKNRPKLEPPFKSYIYQTKKRWVFNLLRKIGFDRFADILERGFGKVIGEFVCDSIRCFGVPYPAFQNQMDKDILDQTCCTYYQLHRYAYHDKLYGWHISDLKIYDKPKKLSEFFRICDEWKKEEFTPKCRRCGNYERCDADMMYVCAIEGEIQVTRPPQSWCYVEEITE